MNIPSHVEAILRSGKICPLLQRIQEHLEQQLDQDSAMVAAHRCEMLIPIYQRLSRTPNKTEFFLPQEDLRILRKLDPELLMYQIEFCIGKIEEVQELERLELAMQHLFESVA